MSKEFDVNYIVRNGEKHIYDELKRKMDELTSHTIFKQAMVIETEMEKVITELSPEQLKKVSIALENITYSAGILKGLSLSK